MTRIETIEKMIYKNCKEAAEAGRPVIPSLQPDFNYYCPLAITPSHGFMMNQNEITGFTRGFDSRPPNEGYYEVDKEFYKLGQKFRAIALTTGFV